VGRCRDLGIDRGHTAGEVAWVRVRDNSVVLFRVRNASGVTRSLVPTHAAPAGNRPAGR
jgi:hypothetical protein